VPAPISRDPSPTAEGAVRSPGNPEHYMVLEPVEGRVRVFAGDRLIADTDAAIRVLEVGRKVYEPVVYVPAQALEVALEPVERTSHCPLKGDASYYALDGEEIAWSYRSPLGFADQLAGRYAFWATKVRFEHAG